MRSGADEERPPAVGAEASSWNVTPTEFQRSSFPTFWQQRISAIHDGIDSQKAAPNPKVNPLELPDGTDQARGSDHYLREPLHRALPGLPQLHPRHS